MLFTITGPYGALLAVVDRTGCDGAGATGGAERHRHGPLSGHRGRWDEERRLVVTTVVTLLMLAVIAVLVSALTLYRS